MITILKTTANGLEVLNEVCEGSWLNVIDPTPEEINQLERLGILRDFVIYPLDIDERSRTEREDDQILIVLRIPTFQGEHADVPYVTLPLGIVLNGKILVTVCKQDNDILREMVGGRVRGLATGKRNRFVLHLLLLVAAKYLTYLRSINRAVDVLEDKIQASMQNREVFGLFKYQKSLVYFTTALKSNELMMERLQRSQLFKAYPDDEDLLDDVLIENRQAIEMTNISSNILSSMMDAFASIISNNLNVVMKFLASVTIILALPTLIASLYGMNVALPLQEWRYAFLAILLLALGLSAGLVRVFLKRDWM